MSGFRELRSQSVVLRQTNIDTDQIIPARFLSTTERAGLGRNAFNDWRWQADGSPNPEWESNGRTIVPRGTRGTTPWLRTLDLNVVYRPSFAEGLQFKVDVFNVFNEQTAITVDEFGESGTGVPQPETYGRTTGYNAPRSVRFMVQYDF